MFMDLRSGIMNNRWSNLKIKLVVKTSYIWPYNFYMQTKDEISNKKGFGPHNLMFDLKNMEMT